MEGNGTTAEEKLREFIRTMKPKRFRLMTYTDITVECMEFLIQEYPQMRLAHAADMIAVTISEEYGLKD